MSNSSVLSWGSKGMRSRLQKEGHLWFIHIIIMKRVRKVEGICHMGRMMSANCPNALLKSKISRLGLIRVSKVLRYRLKITKFHENEIFN
jgi:hypothetical protein